MLHLITASADLKYVLLLSRKYNDQINHIYIINNEKLFEFSKTIESDNIKFFQISIVNYLPLTPIAALLQRKEIRSTIRRYFSNFFGGRVVVYNLYYNYFLTPILTYLQQRDNEVVLCDHYAGDAFADFLPMKNTLKESYLKLVLKFFSPNFSFNFYSSKNSLAQRVIKFSNDKISKIKNDKYLEDESRIDKFKYSANVNSKPAVLFLDHGKVTSDSIIKDFAENMRNVLDLLKKHFSVYVKPHPRLGKGKYIDDDKFYLLPDYIPAEFIKLDSFDLIVSGFSVSLAKMASSTTIRCVSVINLFSWCSDDTRNYYLKFLRAQSKNKIIFVESLSEFENSIKQKLYGKN